MEEIKQELMLKKKFSVRTLLKVLIIVVAVLGLSLVSLIFIPVKYSVNLHLNEATKITMYQNGNASSVIYKSDKAEEFKKIVNTFNSTYSVDKVANALFTGKIDNKEKIEYNYQSSVESNVAKSSSSESKYIMFSYDTEQQIILNGKEYTTSELNSASEMYRKVLVEINNSSTLTKSTIYYINESGNSSFRVTFYSTGNKLYELINTYFE